MKIKLTIVLLALSLQGRPQAVNAYDIIIDEIMANPKPAAGLPGAAFIELKNISRQPVNLQGWYINETAINNAFTLKPDSFVVICAAGDAALLPAPGNTIGLNRFPQLKKDGGILQLRSKEGKTIHTIAYTAAWYGNTLKSRGGWSLEMIDTRHPCSGTGNWIASSDPRGGTPGIKNSADAPNKDLQPSVLLSAYATDSMHVQLFFSEPVDSLKAAALSNYNISNGIGAPRMAFLPPPLFNIVELQTGQPLEKNIVYHLTANHIPGCLGNTMQSGNTVKLGLALPAAPLDLVINEILFHPLPGGSDYVELYNRSNKSINLKDCFIANRANGNIAAVKQIATENRMLFPGEYLAITADETSVKNQYLAKDPGAFASINTMPSYPNDKGDALILNAQGVILDELAYDASWHFKLITRPEGVALERIDYNKPAADAANWHSAAASAGYGTPGYRNSQFRSDSALGGTIRAMPRIFSPDNDGIDDFLTIQYRFAESGYVCNIIIFDGMGRPVRYLVRNALCGPQGYFRWDGLDENNARLPIGPYIVFAEVFNLKGKTAHFKEAVILGRKL